MVNLSTNLENIHQRIAHAEQAFHRRAGSVALLAVSKGQPVAKIASLIEANHHQLGENYLQEALAKISALGKKDIAWHFIGRIQAKKVPLIARNFSWVHTVTRLSDAQKLSTFRAPVGTPLDLCIQVKIDPAPQKGGVLLGELPALVAAIKPLPYLRLRGLMAIGPPVKSFSEQCHYFGLVKEAFLKLNQEGAQLDTLSMGMTEDLEAAIAQGATIVRVGTGLFGPRQSTR